MQHMHQRSDPRHRSRAWLGLLLTALLASGACVSLASGSAAMQAQAGADTPGGWRLALPRDSAVRNSAAAGTMLAAGDAFFDSTGAVEAQAGMARITSGAPGARQYGAALYGIDLGGAAPSGVLVDIFTNLAPQDAGSSYWIGVADYAAERWDWHGPYVDSVTYLPLTGAGLASPGGNLVLAILAYDGAACYCARLEVNPQLITVGPGRDTATLEEAYIAAAAGAAIVVYPQSGNAPYLQPALQIYKSGISFHGVIAGGARVKLDGAGFNYTGAGAVPRAIFQFNPGADGGSVEGFELYNATNDTHNGAAVRINQANDVLVRNCEIRDNDMGLMSNGSVSADTARNQRIEFCHIHHNGNLTDPGYNHNLYLGGTSVLARGCVIHHSLTGHNFKSRAHFNRVEGCYVYYSANREFDLVDDAENTAAQNSHSVLLDNVIIKDPACPGNRAVLQFGQDGGNAHNGTLYLVHNTIATPFQSPVVTLSATGAGLELHNNIVWDMQSGQSDQALLAVSGGALEDQRRGRAQLDQRGPDHHPGNEHGPWQQLPRRAGRGPAVCGGAGR